MLIRKLKVLSVSLIMRNSAVFLSPMVSKLQLVVSSDVPQLRDVEGGQARTAANQDRFGCFARNELSRTF